MNKYIIKNCPAYLIEEDYCSLYSEICSDCTDCVLKQIVQLCKDAFKWQYAGTAHDAQSRYVKAEFANELLSMLDIQEVE